MTGADEELKAFVARTEALPYGGKFVETFDLESARTAAFVRRAATDVQAAWTEEWLSEMPDAYPEFYHVHARRTKTARKRAEQELAEFSLPSPEYAASLRRQLADPQLPIELACLVQRELEPSLSMDAQYIKWIRDS